MKSSWAFIVFFGLVSLANKGFCATTHTQKWIPPSWLTELVWESYQTKQNIDNMIDRSEYLSELADAKSQGKPLPVPSPDQFGADILEPLLDKTKATLADVRVPVPPEIGPTKDWFDPDFQVRRSAIHRASEAAVERSDQLSTLTQGRELTGDIYERYTEGKALARSLRDSFREMLEWLDLPIASDIIFGQWWDLDQVLLPRINDVLDASKEKHVILEKEVALREMELGNLKANLLQALRAETTILSKEKETLDAKVSKLQEEQSQIEELKKQLDQMAQAIVVAKEQQRQYQAQLNNLTARRATLQNEAAQLNRTIRELELDVQAPFAKGGRSPYWCPENYPFESCTHGEIKTNYTNWIAGKRRTLDASRSRLGVVNGEIGQVNGQIASVQTQLNAVNQNISQLTAKFEADRRAYIAKALDVATRLKNALTDPQYRNIQLWFAQNEGDTSLVSGL